MSLSKPKPVLKVAVIGAGQWGSTLAALSQKAGSSTSLYDWNVQRAAMLQKERRDPSRFKDLILPQGVLVTSDLASTVAGADVVMIAVPTSSMRKTANALRPHITRKQVFLHGSKGLEPETRKRMTQVIHEELRTRLIGALSGPNLAEEFARGLPGATVIASKSRTVVYLGQKAFSSAQFRVYGNKDVVGVELCGAFKNILALAAGSCATLELGENTLAMLICRGIHELGRLVHSLGGKSQTLTGLAGVGDILATCTSPLSRNFRAGRLLAQGVNLDEIHRQVGATIEGLLTLPVAIELGAKHRVELPIAQAVQSVLHGRASIRDAIAGLMTRPTTWEFQKEA